MHFTNAYNITPAIYTRVLLLEVQDMIFPIGYFESPLWVSSIAHTYSESVGEFRKQYHTLPKKVAKCASIVDYMAKSVLIDSQFEGVREDAQAALQLLASRSRVDDAALVKSNAYYTTVHIPIGKFGKWRTYPYTVKPSTIFTNAALCTEPQYDFPYSYALDGNINSVILTDGDKVYCSANPIDVFGREDIFTDASGNILILGAGLGHAVFQASEKDDVTSVTVIEPDEDLAVFFTEHILPQFPHAEKVTVCVRDPIEFMEDLNDGEYDLCYENIVQDAKDTFLLIRLHKTFMRFFRMPIYCRSSVALSALFARYVVLALDQALPPNLRYYRSEELLPICTEAGRAAYRLACKMIEKQTVRTEEDLDAMLHGPNVLAMILHTPLNELSLPEGRISFFEEPSINSFTPGKSS